jgi:hypothetical protein
VMWASAVVVEAIQIIMNVSWKVWWKRKSWHKVRIIQKMGRKSMSRVQMKGRRAMMTRMRGWWRRLEMLCIHWWMWSMKQTWGRVLYKRMHQQIKTKKLGNGDRRSNCNLVRDSMSSWEYTQRILGKCSFHQVCMWKSVQVLVRAWLNVFCARVYACESVWRCIYVCVCVHACVHVFVHVCVYLCICVCLPGSKFFNLFHLHCRFHIIFSRTLITIWRSWLLGTWRLVERNRRGTIFWVGVLIVKNTLADAVLNKTVKVWLFLFFPCLGLFSSKGFFFSHIIFFFPFYSYFLSPIYSFHIFFFHLSFSFIFVDFIFFRIFSISSKFFNLRKKEKKKMWKKKNFSPVLPLEQCRQSERLL